MSGSTRRQERTITVETQALGVVRVRRISLGGMARIAERMRAEGHHDETALGEALVAEVVVAGLPDDAATGPAEDLGARLGQLSDEDRRSIAAAVLTLEGVKGAGDGVLEDPRATLARRYSHVLETRRHDDQLEHVTGTGEDAHGVAASPPDAVPGAAQIPLFAGLLPPSPAPASAHADGEPARPASRAPASWERERATLQADIADLEALLSQQAQQREALEADVASADDKTLAAQRAARRHRWLAAAALALLVVVAGAQFAWIGMLRHDAAEQRTQFEAQLQLQQQALEQAQRDAVDANARAERLAARRAPTAQSARSGGAPKHSTTAKGSGGRTSSTKASTAKPSTARPSSSKSSPAKTSPAGSAGTERKP